MTMTIAITRAIARAAFPAAALLGATASTARAQTERSDCRSSAADLRTRSHNATPWAVAHCPSSGPPVLVDRWAQRDAPGGKEGPELVDATSTLRDARLFGAVRDVATAADRSVADRLAALQTLIRYHDPHYEASMEYLTRPSTWWSPIAETVDGPTPIDGASPLPATARRDIAEVFAQLASSDNNGTIRRAALRLRQVVADDDPSATPLRPGSVSLAAGCGSRATLRSTADIGLTLQLRILGTTFDKPFGIRAASEAKPVLLPLSLPAGTIVATYGGREVARLSERNGPCPPGMTP